MSSFTGMTGTCRQSAPGTYRIGKTIIDNTEISPTDFCIDDGSLFMVLQVLTLSGPTLASILY